VLKPPIAQDPEDVISPTERWLPLSVKLALYTWVGVIFFQAATAFAEYHPGQPWPAMLSVLRTFTFLPIHEAGHLIFIFFGKSLHYLGGSFWQIMFPLLWFIIAVRQRSHVAPFPLFWVGENMMDVSLYMRDAPVRQLPLLGGHTAGHDWFTLFSMWNMMDDAGLFADIFYYCGIIICLAAIVGGTILAARSFPHPPYALPAPISISSTDVESSLEEALEKKQRTSPE